MCLGTLLVTSEKLIACPYTSYLGAKPILFQSDPSAKISEKVGKNPAGWETEETKPHSAESLLVKDQAAPYFHSTDEREQLIDTSELQTDPDTSVPFWGITPAAVAPACLPLITPPARES